MKYHQNCFVSVSLTHDQMQRGLLWGITGCASAIQKACLFGSGECICLSTNKCPNAWAFCARAWDLSLSYGTLSLNSQILPSICHNKAKWSISEFRERLNQIIVHTDQNPGAALLLLLGWSWGMHIQLDTLVSKGIINGKPVKVILGGRKVFHKISG